MCTITKRNDDLHDRVEELIRKVEVTEFHLGLIITELKIIKELLASE